MSTLEQAYEDEYRLKYVKEFFGDPPVHDPVKTPKHYQLLPGVEVKHVRYAILETVPEGTSFNAVDYWSRSWEYLTRMWGKNGLEDAEKAYVYLGWLIEEMKGYEDEA